MKRYLFIVLFLSVLISFHSTNALVGGPGMTITVLSVPSEIQDGDTITINSTTSLQSGGFPPMGEVTFLKISDQMTLGPNTDGTMTPVTVPVIKFRPYESFTLHAIHIPISNVENIVGPAFYWYLYDNLSAPALVEGQIHKNSIDKMITEENPIVNMATKATALSIAVWNWMFPRHIVASQLHTLIAVGTAMAMVDTMNDVPRSGFMPLWYMW